MKHNEKSPTDLASSWIKLVGDNESFEGETVEDKRILIDVAGKTSFAWEEEDELIRQANKHNYGVSILIFDKAEWKESYYRGTRNKNNYPARRKAA